MPVCHRGESEIFHFEPTMMHIRPLLVSGTHTFLFTPRGGIRGRTLATKAMTVSSIGTMGSGQISGKRARPSLPASYYPKGSDCLP